MPEPITNLGPDGGFGQAFNMESLRRADGVFPNSMIVGIRGIDSVFRPRSILLPHQLYVKRFQEMRDAGAQEVWVHPLFGTFTDVWTRVELPPE